MKFHMAWTGRLSNSCGVSVPRGIGNLKELEILEFVDVARTSRKAVKELGALINLMKLGVTLGASKQKNKMLCSAIEKLTSLCYLSIALDNTAQRSGASLKCLHSVSFVSPLLRTLRLSGSLGEMPGWFGALVHLVKIVLRFSNLTDGDNSMNILGALPKLRALCFAWESFVGEKLVFRAGTFINLRQFIISSPGPMRELTFEEDTSLHLENIETNFCSLESGITGIRHLPSLKEISLSCNAKVARLGVLQREVDAHPNHPILRLYQDWSDHDLGDVVQTQETAESSLRSEPAATAGESSHSQGQGTTESDSEDDLR